MQKRITLLVVVSILIVLASLGFISHLSVQDSINRSMADHLMLASNIGKNIEYILERNITRLHDISISGVVDFGDNDWGPEKKALKTAYEYSVFTDGIFLLDMYGDVVLTYPHKEEGGVNLLGVPFVDEAVTEGKTVVSNVYTYTPTQKKVVFILVPLKDRNGETIGAVGGEINPANYMFTRIIKSIPAIENSCVELIDSHGIVISSNERKRILTYSDHNKYLGNLIAQKKSTVGSCHRCHSQDVSQLPEESDMLAFAPLSIAPWGVSVREPQEAVFAPATTLRRSFAVISLIFMATALLLAIGLSRSIVKPIRMLTGATETIAAGNLLRPIKVSRGDEIGALARGLETMRTKLSESLDRIRRYNVGLEKRVLERTNEVQKQKNRLASLLNEVIRAQEEERKRIARELHDETSQSIAAIGMALEIASIALKEDRLSPQMLQEQRESVAQVIEGINRLIQDLRPTVLDDLGFASSIRWLLERHLKEKGINYYLSLCDRFDDTASPLMDDKTELRLFRIIQEATINISKYSFARNAVVDMSCSGNNIDVEIRDDGAGFEVEKVLNAVESGKEEGFGILGMKERVEHLNGTMKISSVKGEGTQISITIPAKDLAARDVQN